MHAHQSQRRLASCCYAGRALEVLGQQVPAELGVLPHDEAGAVGRPRDDAVRARVVDEVVPAVWPRAQESQRARVWRGDQPQATPPAVEQELRLQHSRLGQERRRLAGASSTAPFALHAGQRRRARVPCAAARAPPAAYSRQLWAVTRSAAAQLLQPLVLATHARIVRRLGRSVWTQPRRPPAVQQQRNGPPAIRPAAALLPLSCCSPWFWPRMRA